MGGSALPGRLGIFPCSMSLVPKGGFTGGTIELGLKGTWAQPLALLHTSTERKVGELRFWAQKNHSPMTNYIANCKIATAVTMTLEIVAFLPISVENS